MIPPPFILFHLPVLTPTSLHCVNLFLESFPKEIEFYILAPKEVLVQCQSLCRKPKKAVPLRLESGYIKAVQTIAELNPAADFIIIGANVIPQTQNWFESLQQGALANPALSVIGVKTLSPQLTIYSFGRRIVSLLGIHEAHSNLWWGEENLGQTSLIEKIDSVAGTLCYIRRQAYDQVGGFDPELCPWKYDPLMAPQGIELDDFCLRTVVAGFHIQVDPQVEVIFLSIELTDEEKKVQPNILAWTYQYWEKKWGWNPEYPEPHTIRKQWIDTPLCRWIGKNLEDSWTSPQPPVDIVILTYHDLPNLKECFKHLEKMDYPHATVWILNHGCTDSTSEYLKTLPEHFPFPLKVIDSPINIGIAAANNWMIKVTDAPLIAFLDSDAFVPPHWLSHLVETLHRHPYAGVVGIKVVDRDAPQTITWSEKRLWDNSNESAEETDCGQRDYLARTLITTGCCQVYRRKVFSIAGVFDLNFGPVGLCDVDHHIATRIAGYDILYDGFVTVRHSFRKRLKKEMKFLSANQSKMAMKWGASAFYVLDRSLDAFDRQETFPSPFKSVCHTPDSS